MLAIICKEILKKINNNCFIFKCTVLKEVIVGIFFTIFPNSFNYYTEGNKYI